MSSHISDSIRMCGSDPQQFLLTLNTIVEKESDKVSTIMQQLKELRIISHDQSSLEDNIINFIKLGLDKNWLKKTNISLIHQIASKHIKQQEFQAKLQGIVVESFKKQLSIQVEEKKDSNPLKKLFQESELNEIMNYFGEKDALDSSFLSAFASALDLLPKEQRFSTALMLSWLLNPLSTHSFREELLVILKGLKQEDRSQFIMLIAIHLCGTEDVTLRQNFMKSLATMYAEAKAGENPIEKITRYCAENEGVVISPEINAKAVAPAVFAAANPPAPNANRLAVRAAALAAAAAPAVAAVPAVAAFPESHVRAMHQAIDANLGQLVAAVVAVDAATAEARAPKAQPARSFSKEQLQKLTMPFPQSKKELCADFINKNLNGIDERRLNVMIQKILSGVPERCYGELFSLLETINAEPEKKIDLIEIALDTLKKYKYDMPELSEIYSSKLMILGEIFAGNMNHEKAILCMQRWESLTDAQQNKATMSMQMLWDQDALLNSLFLLAYSEPNKEVWNDYVDDLSAVIFATDRKHFQFWVEMFQNTTKKARADILNGINSLPKDSREILIDSLIESFQQMDRAMGGKDANERLNTMYLAMSGF